MEEQLYLFEESKILKEEEEDNIKLVFGGIYTEKNPDERDPDGPYAICFGGNMFHFIFDGITCYDDITELGCAHKMMLVEGYSLAMKRESTDKPFTKIQIRHSGRKHEPDYIIFECNCGPYFHKSLEQKLKILHK
jgi:hypothetical protein